MKKLTAILLTSLFLFYNIPIKVNAIVKSPPSGISADSVVLLDATTGKILYEKNKDSAYPPASTTKIMTILLVLEKSNLNDVVTVSKNASLADGSSIYLVEGEKITVRELLYGLILASANDCAVALAEHVSGSTEKFAKLMNTRADALGCKNTNFVNPNGLYNIKHKTSAYALSLIMQELIKHPEYKVISTTPSYKMATTNKSKISRPLWNENRLIHKDDPNYYSGSEGGKTGYTTESQHSYIAVATRNGQRLIVALVHDSKKTFFPDSRKLLDYGFENFELAKQFSKNDVVSNLTLDDGTVLPLLASKDLYILKAKNSTSKATTKISQNKLNFSSIKKGELVNTAVISFGGDTYPLGLTSGVDYTKKNVSLKNNISSNSLIGTNSLSGFINIIKYVFIVLVLLIVFLRIRTLRRRKARKRTNNFIYNSRNRRW
ncbi:D-alanyl-D-alanine carboxypeptidase family protein [Clostridium estertheticum]|uniref:D-alanyl-D-alanine carboxypeptidase family protein n=1 Tax=Clostridium estertheticum TaxID=238834 RepID=UPI001CF1BEAA|nr:D-alanyl-D-alanine carboxypeptidase family protein [Clostridium estertheticum]MCB2354292.1 D-alanyl-D-alanine carboxypeptidase [Clostridium estertheticum]WAG42588.1 D-alanyl-D-alanine carboxypeptidase [Clostridium estertheticum]